MEENIRQHMENYVSTKNQHPAWILLTSRRVPLVLSCLKTLFERAHDGIPLEGAIQSLSGILIEHVSQRQCDINQNNPSLQASREPRERVKRRLIVEWDGRIFATDALEVAIAFVESLDNRFMASAVFRLSTVRREIESLEARPNPSPINRVAALRHRIAELKRGLQEAEARHIEVLETHQAVEHIREVFNLASSLRVGFRHAEDSWREADRALHQSIISEQYHHGDVVERLLNDQDALLSTPEGRVFDSLQRQLRQSVELTTMSERLRIILSHPSASNALNRLQCHDLRWLVKRLVDESQVVLQARARNERDVRGFMKAGLVAERHRVGRLLNEFLNLALRFDWQCQMIHKQEVPLPAIGVAVTGVPAIKRLRFKEVDDETGQTLDLSNHATGLTQIGDNFWDTLNDLDRGAPIQQTLQLLARENRLAGLTELATLLPSTHDLETLAIQIGMARETGIEVIDSQREFAKLNDGEDRRRRFNLLMTGLESQTLMDIDQE